MEKILVEWGGAPETGRRLKSNDIAQSNNKCEMRFYGNESGSIKTKQNQL